MSKEGNKSKFFTLHASTIIPTNDLPLDVAENSDASAGTRASAAKDAVGDKANEVKHSVRWHSP